MAIKRVSLAELRADPPKVDRVRMAATTEEDIARHGREDGEPEEPLTTAAILVVPAATVRKQLGLTQPDFAALIGVPVGTVRNWEQGRVVPDAAARALLVILHREPNAAVRALRAV